MICPSCNSELDERASYCGQCGRHSVARFDPLVGTVIDGRFRIDAKIAVGGFGAIYRATCLANGVPIAIKILHSQFAADPHLSARFRREGAALTSLRDPHTVRTYALGDTADGTLYIAMELLEGESLQDRFRARGALPWRDVLRFVGSACSSLHEAHQLGIVHRDLKPANLFLVANGCVKVLDFGIAKIQHGSYIDDGSELTRVGQAIGTLEYMSPEQLVGGEIDARTDLFTLGVVAYEMITGQRPFSDATGPTSLITALMTSVPPPPSTMMTEPLPPEVDEIIMRCLERDATRRYDSVEQLAIAIRSALERHSIVRPELEATRPLWNGGQQFAALVDDEPTWIETRPVFDDVVRQHVIASLVPTLQNLPPPPLAFAPQGTDTLPSFDAQIAGTTVGPRPRSPWRFAAWAAGLLAVGAAVGMAIASFV